MKAKVELTAETVREAIKDGKPTSMTQLAHLLGYKGSVSSSLTKKFRKLVPEIDALLKGTVPTGTTSAAGKAVTAKAKPKPAKPPPQPAGAKAGKYTRDPRNPFREGSSYATVFDILASHRDGMEKEMLVRLVAAQTSKTLVRSGYDCQVVLSARPNDDGLNNNESPRNRSCRPGFWIKRENGHVQLMVD